MTKEFSDLTSDLDSRIADEFEDLYDYPRQRDDKLTELAEEQIPDRHADLAELLVSDHSFAEGDWDMLGENPTVWDIIQSALRPRLISAAQAEYKRLEEEYDEMKDDLEAMGYQVGITARQHPDGKRTYYIYWEREAEEGKDPEEVIVGSKFKSEMEAWKWLDLNEEGLHADLKSPESK